MVRYVDSEDMAKKLWQHLEALRGELQEKERQKEQLEMDIPRLRALVEAISQAYDLQRQYEQILQLPLIPSGPATLAEEIASVLDDGVPRTVQEIVEVLKRRSWRFDSAFPGRSVHAALIAVRRRGLAVKEGDRWRKK